MTREYLLELGKRVKMIRKELRISQKDFANKINISGSYLSEVEAGKSKPGYDFLFNISKICNVSLAYVLHGVGEIFTGIDYGLTITSKEPEQDHIDTFPSFQIFQHSIIPVAERSGAKYLFYFLILEHLFQSQQVFVPG